MSETQWDIQEIKRLKKKQLIQYNLLMLLLFALMVYFIENGRVFVLLGLFGVVFWIIAANSLYTLITGKPLGTKTSRRVQEFDRNRLGEKRWKRRTMIGAVILSVVSVVFTIYLFIGGFDTVRMSFSINAFPFIFVWAGSNLGEIIRISYL